MIKRLVFGQVALTRINTCIIEYYQKNNGQHIILLKKCDSDIKEITNFIKVITNTANEYVFGVDEIETSIKTMLASLRYQLLDEVSYE